jgi:hypothetical protein
VNKFYSPGQKNQCYLFCIMRKFVQRGKYFRSHAVPPYTSVTVRIFLSSSNITINIFNINWRVVLFISIRQVYIWIIKSGLIFQYIFQGIRDIYTWKQNIMHLKYISWETSHPKWKENKGRQTKKQKVTI